MIFVSAVHNSNLHVHVSSPLKTALTLAVAESKYEFEHRDLHWGNILLSNTDAVEAVFVLNGRRITVPTAGIKVTIIDYTLSRMLYKRAYLQFNDLAHDEDLFSATGDYQFEIYRLMRKRLDNVWSAFDPYTNVLWLHYALDKMINGARYRLKQSKKHKNAIREMIKLLDNVLDFKSAAELAKLFFGPEDGQHQ